MSILIDANTTFIVQGITGREAVNLTRENLDYGSKIIGGVTPGRAGRDVYGVPVYDCVRDITSKTKVDGSVVCDPRRRSTDRWSAFRRASPKMPYSRRSRTALG